MNRFERWSIWISAVLVTVTGAGLLWAKYFVANDDPWSVINHPLQPWFLKTHILTAPLLIAALGQIAVRHVWRHFRSALSGGRRSGSMTAVVSVPLILTGYLIQVVTDETWLGPLAITHIALGGVFALGILIHSLVVGRQRGPLDERSYRSSGAGSGPARPRPQRAEALSSPADAHTWGAEGD